MTGGQGVAARVGAGGDVVDIEQPGHRLLLQPLAGVAGIDPRAGRELGPASRARVAEGGVEPELDAELDRQQVEGAEQAPRTGVRRARRGGRRRRGRGARLVCSGGHGGAPCCAGIARWSLVRTPRQRTASAPAQASGPNASG